MAPCKDGLELDQTFRSVRPEIPCTYIRSVLIKAYELRYRGTEQAALSPTACKASLGLDLLESLLSRVLDRAAALYAQYT